MTTTLILDTLDQCQIQHNTNGMEVSRGGVIKNVPINSVCPGTTMFDALNLNNMPKIGDEFPNTMSAGGLSYLRLVHRRVKSISQKDYRIELVYRNVQSQIRIGTSLLQVQTNKDYNGDLILATHGTDEDQVATVSKLVPTTTVTISRQEYTNPFSKIQTYNGTMNSGTWQLPDLVNGGYFNIDGTAKRWLITSIQADSTDTGLSWDISYTFQYTVGGWDQYYAWIDPKTNRPPTDVTVQYAQIYTTTNYNSLALP